MRRTKTLTNIDFESIKNQNLFADQRLLPIQEEVEEHLRIDQSTNASTVGL